MTRETIRMQLWIDEYKNYKGRFNNKEAAVKFADEVLEVFDKRFPATSAKFQTHTLTLDGMYEKLNNLTSVKPPNNTGELGVMLDTERPWYPNYPVTNKNVEVLYIDGTTDFGWFGYPVWFTKKDSVYGLDKAGKWSETEKAVVAWRELPQ